LLLFLAQWPAALAFAADTPTDTEVPFTQAIASARRVADLNTGWRVYLSRGESMLPQIGHDSLLLVARGDYAQLTIGMLVVYRDSDGDLVSHRLIARTSEGWVAKGINNYDADPGLVTSDNFQGTVFGIMQYQIGTDDLSIIPVDQRPAIAYAKSINKSEAHLTPLAARKMANLTK